MKRAEIKVGSRYVAKVSNRLVPIEVLEICEDRIMGRSRTTWRCRNCVTGRIIRVISPQRFRRPAN